MIIKLNANNETDKRAAQEIENLRCALGCKTWKQVVLRAVKELGKDVYRENGALIPRKPITIKYKEM